ncbi:MAG: ribonuclease J [Bacillota bacterium]|jgi:ribonuclease J
MEKEKQESSKTKNPVQENKNEPSKNRKNIFVGERQDNNAAKKDNNATNIESSTQNKNKNKATFITAKRRSNATSSKRGAQEQKNTVKSASAAKNLLVTDKPLKPSTIAKQKLTVSSAKDNKEKKLKVIPLGGLGEVGKNMTLIQYGDEIIVIDGGVMFPEDELLGIDLVIPDYTYLLENKEKVKAIFLTHGHEDHIGGIPYLLKDINVPVYGSRLTLGLLQGKLQEHKIKADLKEVKASQKVKVESFSVEFIHVSHSIPDSLAMAIQTPLGTIVFICDFKLDMSPIDGRMIDLDSFSRLGKKGVLLLLSDSTNVERKGFTPSEKTVGENFDRIFLSAEGRIIITSFASNVHRIQQAFWSAEKCHRKVAVVGRGMQNVTNIASELGYLQIPADTLIEIDEINKYQDNEILILTTGSQGEPLSGLTRMALSEHRQVHIGKGDLVVMSATPIPGNERLVARTVDNLFRLGATVIYEKSEGIHVSGHASQDELSIMLNIIKPRFFMPMHGEYRMLYKHARLAQSLGVSAENIFILENGQVLEVGRRHCRINGSVPAGRILIDGLGIGDVGNMVLKERKLLSEGGIVIINMIIDKRSGVMLFGPEIFSRGFIFEKEYEHIIEEAREKVVSIYASERASKEATQRKIDCSAIKAQISNNLSRCFFNRTGRRPIILPIINEV